MIPSTASSGTKIPAMFSDLFNLSTSIACRMTVLPCIKMDTRTRMAFCIPACVHIFIRQVVICVTAANRAGRPMRLDAAIAGGRYGGEQGDTHQHSGEQAEQTGQTAFLHHITFLLLLQQFCHIGIHPAGRPAYPAVMTAYYTPGKKSISSRATKKFREMTTFFLAFPPEA